MAELTPETIIRMLDLEPLHQEGGYFRQTWRWEDKPSAPSPGGATATAIYLLLTTDQFSALHRLASDEVWVHHLGDPMEMLMLHPDGTGEVTTIGPDLTAGHSPQHICPALTWQGTRLAPGRNRMGFALASCIMTPGFNWEDFELGDRNSLTSTHPDFAREIIFRTRSRPVKGQA